MSVMPATEDPATPVASGVPAGVGWVYLQPAPVTLVHYRHKQSIGLGAAQIVLGSLCIILNVIDLAIGDIYGYGVVGHGIWCGALFIVTGSFGVSAGHTKTKCKVVAYMVLCIISASFTSALLICGIMAAVRYGPYSVYCQHGSTSYYCSEYTSIVAIESLLAVCGVIAAILFILGSVLTCKVAPCCCGQTEGSFQQVAFPQNYASTNGFQVIHMTQYGQPMMPCQPGLTTEEEYC